MGSIVGSADRLDVWRDLIREHFVALDIDAEIDSPFSGLVRSTPIGHLQVSTVDSRTQGFHRTAGLARRDSDAYLQVGLVARGEGYLRQDSRETVVKPGDFAVYETDRPFFWGLRGDWQLLVFTWPRATVALEGSESQRLTARAVDGGKALGGIVGRMLSDLVAAPPTLSVAGGARLADEVSELVTTATTESVAEAGQDLAAADLSRRITAYISEHLADPDLGPTEIARAHFISTRQMHRLFARQGTTVTQQIRGQRLERCRRDLLDPRGRDRSITDIARRWGFSDLATFSRSFQRAYRMSPSGYRAQYGSISGVST